MPRTYHSVEIGLDADPGHLLVHKTPLDGPGRIRIRELRGSQSGTSAAHNRARAQLTIGHERSSESSTSAAQNRAERSRGIAAASTPPANSAAATASTSQGPLLTDIATAPKASTADQKYSNRTARRWLLPR